MQALSQSSRETQAPAGDLMPLFYDDRHMAKYAALERAFRDDYYFSLVQRIDEDNNLYVLLCAKANTHGPYEEFGWGRYDRGLNRWIFNIEDREHLIRCDVDQSVWEGFCRKLKETVGNGPSFNGEAFAKYLEGRA